MIGESVVTAANPTDGSPATVIATATASTNARATERITSVTSSLLF
jgi:hypothetical protein